tara:strand:- start:250 stop:627 length:378 start_codon:yes stop_codon:yes gene_type:complete
MAVKLVVLKSGEDVITDITEMVLKEKEDNPKAKKVVGYFLTRPCGVTLNNRNIDINDDNKDAYQIKLFPWCPLTKDNRIPFPTDWVVTVLEPIDKLKEMYVTEVLGNVPSQSVNSDEQSDPGLTD